jgi:hypothetical protein
MRRNCYADKAFATIALADTRTGSLWKQSEPESQLFTSGGESPNVPNNYFNIFEYYCQRFFATG